VFIFFFIPKNYRFSTIILYNGTKHDAKNLAKWLSFSILDFWPQETKNSPKEPQEAMIRVMNSVFWMKLNITLKILAFYILPFQNSWHFVFCVPWVV